MAMSKKTIRLLIASILVFALLGPIVEADDWYEPDPGYFTLVDENGDELTVMAREIYAEDEYISSDNKHYKVTRVDKDKRIAYAKYQGEASLETILVDNAVKTAALSKDACIVMYSTHNSESYLPSDGKQSIKGGGGILDVGEAFKKNLEKRGIKAVFDKTAHDPHDAGAYRRSRQTASKLIKSNMPIAAVFDIHRDGVPKSHYVTKVDGQDMSMVRIVIGRRNQNRKANEELAKKVKSVADKTYPGLIKDIFIGKGTYNQELSPRSLLFEFGTLGNSKEAAQKSTAYLAEVISNTMFGGQVKKHDQEKGDTEGEQIRVKPIDKEKSTAGRSGILWLVIIAVVGIVGFLFISTGSREMRSKFKKSDGQDFSSFFGRRKKRK